MKHCNKCNLDKEETEFVFKNKEKGVRQSICKDCQKAYKLKYYYNNKKSHFLRNRKQTQKITEYVNDLKKQGCKVCGETCLPCLDFHHLHNKKEILSVLRRQGSLEKVKEEVLKCIILCANCHRKYHFGLLSIEL